jgi:hypothetical protein
MHRNVLLSTCNSIRLDCRAWWCMSHNQQPPSITSPSNETRCLGRIRRGTIAYVLDGHIQPSFHITGTGTSCKIHDMQLHNVLCQSHDMLHMHQLPFTHSPFEHVPTCIGTWREQSYLTHQNKFICNNGTVQSQGSSSQHNAVLWILFCSFPAFHFCLFCCYVCIRLFNFQLIDVFHLLSALCRSS